MFLLDVFAEDEDLATAVNHLLVVGFYLVNLGYVCLALKVGDTVVSTTHAMEALSVKVGAVVLVLGVLHLPTSTSSTGCGGGHSWPRLRCPPVSPDAYWTTSGALQSPA